jgi:hypothetical protein
VNTVDSASGPASATLIEYPAGMEPQAKAVAAAVTGGKLVETSDVPRVTLVLGADGVQVNGLARTQSGPAQTGTASSAAKQTTAKATKSSPTAPAAGVGCIN